MNHQPLAQILQKSSALLGLLSLMLFTACESSKPASSGFASVDITNHSPDEIIATSVQVFRENGYAARQAGPGQMIFEKEGSQANNIAYNGVVDAHYGSKTLVRFRTELVDLQNGSYRLQGQAYMVRNAEDSFFEDESRLTNMRSGPYRKILAEIAKKLN